MSYNSIDTKTKLNAADWNKNSKGYFLDKFAALKAIQQNVNWGFRNLLKNIHLAITEVEAGYLEK